MMNGVGIDVNTMNLQLYVYAIFESLFWLNFPVVKCKEVSRIIYHISLSSGILYMYQSCLYLFIQNGLRRDKRVLSCLILQRPL
jgi:hypothetical protein